MQHPQNVDSLKLYSLALRGSNTLTPRYHFSPTIQFYDFNGLDAAIWNYPLERALERLGNMVVELAGRGTGIHQARK